MALLLGGLLDIRGVKNANEHTAGNTFLEASPLGVEPRAMTPAQFQEFIAAEIAKWAKVIDFAGIKPE